METPCNDTQVHTTRTNKDTSFKGAEDEFTKPSLRVNKNGSIYIIMRSYFIPSCKIFLMASYCYSHTLTFHSPDGKSPGALMLINANRRPSSGTKISNSNEGHVNEANTAPDRKNEGRCARSLSSGLTARISYALGVLAWTVTCPLFEEQECMSLYRRDRYFFNLIYGLQ